MRQFNEMIQMKKHSGLATDSFIIDFVSINKQNVY